jgi:acyl dehydratase
MRNEVQGAICFAGALGGDLDVGFFTGFARQAPGFFRRQPGVAGHESRNRLRRRAGEVRTKRRRQIWPRQKRRAQVGVMTMALDHPANGKRQQLRARIDGKRNQGFASTDFGERGGDRSRHRRPKSDGRLREGVRGGGAVDEFRIGKQRRAGEHDRSNIRMVFGKREHHVMRYMGGAREIFGKSAANERRRIVKQRSQDTPCFLALRFREVAVKKGTREHARPLRPLHGRRGPCPFQEFLSHHGFKIQKHIPKSVSSNMVKVSLMPSWTSTADSSSRYGVHQMSDDLQAERHKRGGIFYEDFVIGALIEHRLTRTVTQMDNMLFSNMTLNPQPLHIDAHYCATETEWGRPLMNSLFTLGLMIGISVNDLTVGTTIANLGMTEVRFPAPLFEGDTVHVTTEILSKRVSQSRPNAGIVEFLHRAYQQEDRLVAECRRQAMMKKWIG